MVLIRLHSQRESCTLHGILHLFDQIMYVKSSLGQMTDILV